MDKKKKQATATGTTPEADPDELALVKAAAWAWHQHSSSSKNKKLPPPEFPLATPRRCSSCYPSRFRLESLAKLDPAASPVHLPNQIMAPVTLLDLYEIERITRELEKFMAASEMRRKVEEKVPVRKSTGRRGLLRRHAVAICGSRGTTVETEALVARRKVY